MSQDGSRSLRSAIPSRTPLPRYSCTDADVRELREIDPTVFKHAASQVGTSGLFNNTQETHKHCELHFDALERVLGRQEGREYLSENAELEIPPEAAQRGV